MIEEYYPEPEAEVESEEEPEYVARFYAQYDYDEIDDNDDNFGDGGVFAYEEDEEEENEHGFEEIDEVDKVDEVDEVSESNRKGQEVAYIESDEDSVVSSNSSSSSGSASGYSEDSFISESSDGSTAARRKGKQRGGDGNMWKSWGVMKSVSDLRHQQEKDAEDEMRELVNMSTSAMYKTGVMSVSEALSFNPSATNTEITAGGSNLLTVDVETDSECSVVNEVERDVNIVEDEDDTNSEPIVTTALPYVQVHSEGQVDEDHQRAWESMSFYQQVQDSDVSSSQILPSSGAGKDIESLKTDSSQSQNVTSKEFNGGKGGVADQKAHWYDMSTIKAAQIHPLHMTEPPRDKDALDDYTRDEGPDGGQCLITPKINLSVKFSIRVKTVLQGKNGQMITVVRRKNQLFHTVTKTQSMPSAQKEQNKINNTRSGHVRRGKYDNSHTIEKHLGDLANHGESGLFAKAKSSSGMSTRTLQQSRTTKNLSLKHQQSVSNAVGVNTLGRKHIHVSRDKANGHTEISFSSCRVVYRLYPYQQPTTATSAFNPPPLPTERYALRVHDMLVSFTQVGRKSKKVLGNWLNPSKPVESHLPLIEITAAGFDLDDRELQSPLQEVPNLSGRARGGAHGLEYRMEVTVLPLRCYLDGSYVNFIRGFLDYLGQQQRRQVGLEKATYARMQKQLGLVSTTHVEKTDGMNVGDPDSVGISTDGEENEMELSVVDREDTDLQSYANVHNPSTVSATTSGKIKDALESSISTNININTSSKSKSNNENIPKPANSDLPNVDLPTPPPLTFFQSWKVNPLELKINYSPNPLDLRALQKGDFMQLLNLLSIDSLELSLTKVWLVGVSGAAAGFSKMGEEWVKEIYAHQMHRLLSSTGPLRGISSIGTSIHGLLLVPVQEYRVNGAVGVLKALKRESVSLLKTVTRETLTAGSKVSHFLANTLIDLVTPEGAVPSNRRHREAGGGRGHRSEKQPTGFTDSLDRAYEAVSREVTSTLDTIVVLPFKEYRRTGHAGGALKCVVRAIPVAVLRPTAGAAEALSYTLLGLRNNLDPDKRRDEEDVWNVNVRE